MDTSTSGSSGDIVVFENLRALLDVCCDDLWRVAAISPEGLLGHKKRRIIRRLLCDLIEEVPDRFRKHVAKEEFEAPDLTNTDAAMLLGQCREAIRISSKQQEQSEVAI